MPVDDDKNGTYIFSSKDLCLIKEIPEIMEMELDSLKIEGRLKTEYYLATVINAYRTAIDDYFENPENVKKVEQLLEVLELDESFEEAGGRLQGKTFVITGSLNHFDNRDACKAEILRLGGKTAGSVSSRTSYLINNDINSNSSKNKKAKELNVPIITEEQFLEMIK